MEVPVTQIFDLKLLLTYCLMPTKKMLFKKLKKFTYRSKTVYFHLSSRRVQALSRPGLMGDRESRASAQHWSPLLITVHTHLFHGDLPQRLRLYCCWELQLSVPMTQSCLNTPSVTTPTQLQTKTGHFGEHVLLPSSSAQTSG